MRSAAVIMSLLLAGLSLPVVASYDDAAVYPTDQSPNPQVADGYGNHIVTRFAISQNAGYTTGVLALEDPDGKPVMHAKVQGGHLYASDGLDDQGDVIYTHVSNGVGEPPYRIDVVLHGDTYMVTYGVDAPVTAKTFHPATQAQPVDDPHEALGVPWEGETVTFHRTRVDDSAMAHDTTFWGPLAGSGFEQVEGEEGDVETRAIDGYQSPGVLQIRRLPDQPLSYIHAPRPAGTDTYHAEASFTPLDDFAVPAGMALVSGLTGPLDEPTVHWAVVVEKVGLDEWALAYQAPDGMLTRVSKADGFTWRSVHVAVDETSDTLLLDVDGGPVYHFTGQDLGTAERIGVGDVFTDPLHELSSLSPLGVARFDDVAIYEKEAP